MSTSKAELPQRIQHRSLRLRLALWYGGLLALALGLFAVLILFLTTDAIGQSVDSAVRAETRVATLDASRELSATPPYWPDRLILNAVEAYSGPGASVELRDAQGNTRYRSAGGTSVPIEDTVLRAALDGQTIWYTARTDAGRVRVEVVPVRVPPPTGAPAPPLTADGAPAGSGQVIGTLLVAKSLHDVDSTLRLLRTLLLVTGLVTLVAALSGGWAIAARVLRPLAEIGGTARAIAAATARGTRIGNLSQRVRRPRGNDELARLVDTFNEMLADLESATRAQRRFVADASHELRAPLTTIQGNLAFLQRHLDDVEAEERRTMLADAHQETLRLARLVEELLLLARVDASAERPAGAPGAAGEAGVSGAHPAPPVELDRALLQLVRQLRSRLASEGSKLRLEIGYIEPARVRGDEETLRRVALILLDNAIKYTSTEGREDTARVTVSLERLDGQAVLRVKDTGIGIAPRDLPHIFERFYRADRARGRQGTGLGLSIAQALVERLGGHITAESVLGSGSTFSVWLPLA